MFVDESELDALADRIAARVAERMPVAEAAGYLNPEGAAAYLGVKRKRIYDLKSAGALAPDGFDGRVPLYTRETLDAYALAARN